METRETDPNRERLDELFSKLCDARLSVAEMAELDEALGQSAEARAHYRQYMNLHAALHAYLAGGTEKAEAPAAEAERPKIVPMIPTGKMRPVQAQPRPKVNPVMLAAAAAVVFGIGFVAVDWLYQNVPGMPGGRAGQFATMTQSFDAKWAPGSFVPTEGKPLGKERLMLESGSIRVRFSRGADVTFVGNTDIEILSENSARLDTGKMLAEVPARSSGFTIETEAFDVIDLGTVFGVTVLESGDVEVSVLSGNVELAVKDEETGDRVAIQQLRKWQSVVAHADERRVEKQRFDVTAYLGMRAEAAEAAEATESVEEEGAGE